MASVEPWPRRAVSEIRTQGSDVQIDNLMQRFFDQSKVDHAKAKPVPVTESALEALQPRRNADTAFDLLDRASQAFEVLISRFEHLEEELRETRAHADAQSSEAASTIDQWKRLASGLKDQLEISDQKLAALKTQHEAVVARASEAENGLKIAERSASQAGERAVQAEDLSTKLHDKVVTAFGIGSRIHSLLEVIKPKAE